MAFLMIDIDHFKEINDNYGHLVGDDVLKEVVQIIQNPIRSIDILGRYGGEEFGLILPETDEDGAMVLAEKIRDNVEKHTFIAGDGIIRLKLAISIGVSIYPNKNVKDVKTLVKNADDALYVSKKEGRNKVSKAN
jgi:two-component system cell cycle response regulator